MSVTCQKMNRRELFNYINEISFAVDDNKIISGYTSMGSECTPLF